MDVPDNLSWVIQISFIQLTSLLGDRDKQCKFALDWVYVLDKKLRATHFCPHAPNQDKRTRTGLQWYLPASSSTPTVLFDTVRNYIWAMNSGNK